MKATRSQVQRRVEELLKIRLEGAELWDIREYVREKTAAKDAIWGKTPLSDAQLYRYLQRVDSQIAESCKGGRAKLVRVHLAKRRNLYARAVNAADYSAALRCLRDEAELLDLYPRREDDHEKRLTGLEKKLRSLSRNRTGGPE